MKKKICVLVTGVGGNIGQGIIKALRLSKYRCRIIGTDMNALSGGLFCCDRGYTVPASQSNKFLGEMVRIIRKEKVDLLFVGSDVEINSFAQHQEEIYRNTGCFVIVSDKKTCSMSTDKWLTYRYCKAASIPYPDTALANHPKDIHRILKTYSFPLIIKPRVGYGSRGVEIIRSKKQLAVALKQPALSKMIVQELIGTPNDEYTAACFVDRHGSATGPIIFRRLLSAGATYKAEVVFNRNMETQVLAIVRKFNVLGPCNIQFRSVKKRVIPFEFNIRFSGTTPMRAALGFNDVEMAIDSFLLKKGIKPPKIHPGVIFRYWNEIILPDQSFAQLTKGSSIAQHPAVVMNLC